MDTFISYFSLVYKLFPLAKKKDKCKKEKLNYRRNFLRVYIYIYIYMYTHKKKLLPCLFIYSFWSI